MVSADISDPLSVIGMSAKFHIVASLGLGTIMTSNAHTQHTHTTHTHTHTHTRVHAHTHTHTHKHIPDLVIEFSRANHTVGEGSQFVTLEILKFGESSRDVEFSVVLEGQTATCMYVLWFES